MDVPTAVVMIILCLVALGFWAGSEFELGRQAPVEDTTDRDAIAAAVGLLPEQPDEVRAEFVDALQARLREEQDRLDGAR